MSARPFLDLLREHRNGLTHEELTDALNTLVEAVSAERKPGKLALAPLQGGAPYAVPARFRYRLEDGKLRLGIKLERVEDLMDRVLEDVIAKIERGSNVSVLDGRAPQPV